MNKIVADIRDETIIDSAVSDSGIPAGVNTGIAIVTPAYKLLDILNRADFQKACDEMETKSLQDDDATTPD